MFELEDLRKLIKGEYHKDEEEYEQMPQDNFKLDQVNEDGKVELNRAMANGKNDPAHELNLENFDDKLDHALWDLQKKVIEKDPRI